MVSKRKHNLPPPLAAAALRTQSTTASTPVTSGQWLTGYRITSTARAASASTTPAKLSCDTAGTVQSAAVTMKFTGILLYPADVNRSSNDTPEHSPPAKSSVVPVPTIPCTASLTLCPSHMLAYNLFNNKTPLPRFMTTAGSILRPLSRSVIPPLVLY
ncbi:hypothetical protein LZ30DRAFT_781418 [Colletotrichum cereale]|nr:hypothetical protein LZ30DRAFT_781418 [Colletotrichum cereale]